LPSGGAAGAGARRSFNASDKTRILAKDERPGQSLPVVARRHGIDKRFLFPRKNDLSAPEPAEFLDVTVADGSELDLSSGPPALSRLAARTITSPVPMVGGRRWATMTSLLETCKLNGVEPQAWLSDVLHRMATGHPASQLDELLPWQWKAAQPPKS
jgi:hypothetical protein